MDPLYDLLAGIWTYPDEGLPARVAQARAALAVRDAERGNAATGALAPRLDPLLALFDGASPEAVEELYTRTFDINPVCTLECGWHLYGQDYARGAFLVRMRGLMRDLGVEESTELPDHLTHVLAVLGRLPPDEGDAFSGDLLAPAFEKMVEGFKDPDNPYRTALLAVASVIRERAVPTGAPDPTGLSGPHGPQGGVEHAAWDAGRACGDCGQGGR